MLLLCSIDLKRQLEHSGLHPDTSSLVYNVKTDGTVVFFFGNQQNFEVVRKIACQLTQVIIKSALVLISKEIIFFLNELYKENLIFILLCFAL